MKLEQGQVWKQGEEIYRIVKLERLAVEYIELAGPHALHRLHHHVSKKAFCRLIKGAELVDQSHVAGGDGEGPPFDMLRAGGLDDFHDLERKAE